MTRQRKTSDEYEIQSNHGYGWDQTTEETLADARAQLKTYRENVPGIPHRIVKKRVRIT
jgi:hypothetical protein